MEDLARFVGIILLLSLVSGPLVVVLVHTKLPRLFLFILALLVLGCGLFWGVGVGNWWVAAAPLACALYALYRLLFVRVFIQ